MRRRFCPWVPALGLALGLVCSPGAGCSARAGAPGVEGAPAPPGGQAARAGERDPALAPAELSGRVVRVRDGDSLVVLVGDIDVEVRLEGIDCPELTQAYGGRARGFTADRSLRRKVRLVVRGRDAYDRELVEAFLPDGRSLNRELVSAGLAWWYRRYSSDPDLQQRERQAREARRGLWADPKPVPPWEFRAAK